MIVYSPAITPRLQYIADFISHELAGKKCIITTNKEVFCNDAGPKINYSHEPVCETELFLPPHGLLADTGIKQQQTDCFNLNNRPVFFKTNGDFPFDIFAASFYLLSRYEEYLPHKKDEYGRFAHTESMAYRQGFLHVPLVNLWMQDFKEALRKKFPAFGFQNTPFTFLPTYDIDEAYAYKLKNFWRTSGGHINSLLKGNLSEISLRMKVNSGTTEDPYNAYAWLDALHEKFSLKPKYFFLVAAKRSRYDKNISPANTQFQSLIAEHASKYEIGIHPSWQSADDAVKLKEEILKLGHITGRQIHSSRQHYIRVTLPGTYRQLTEAGIEEDYSMGYGSINGFRASVASPFYWYDLEKEKQTDLLLYPFCFMEANSFFEQKYSAQQALDEMRQYRDVIQSVNGLMVSIWHNTFLGTAKKFEAWKEIYQQFISETIHSSS
jgi:hypothetical protein